MHYSVLVVGDNPEEQLAPYHEFECTGDDNEYVVDIDKTEHITTEYKQYSQDQLDLNRIPKSLIEFANQCYGMELITADKKPDLERRHKYCYAQQQEDGTIKYIERTNPNKKWDWYQLGGRWEDCLHLKDCHHASSACLGEINWERTNPTYALLLNGQWYEVDQLLDGNNEIWKEKFLALLKDVPAATLVSVYDCHT